MPGGGDCEGTIWAIAASRVQLLFAERKSSATSIDAKPANSGVTDAGGTWGLALQQSALPSHGMFICMQQLCVAACAGTTHVPTDSSRIAIREMATAVREVIPRNIAVRLPRPENLAVMDITGTPFVCIVMKRDARRTWAIWAENSIPTSNPL